MLLDIPQRNEPSVKMPIAEAKTRRVPNLSAIQPLMGMKTARLSVKLASTAFMLSGATPSAEAIVGTAVFRIVVSNDSMKNATAISHGNSRKLAGGSEDSADGFSAS